MDFLDDSIVSRPETEILESYFADYISAKEDLIRILEEPLEDLSKQAAGIITSFEVDRHNRIGKVYSSILGYAPSDNISGHTILAILANSLGLSDETQRQLSNSIDLEKTPDAVYYHGSSKTVIVADFKGQSYSSIKISEAKRKYENAITVHLRSLHIQAETLILGFDPETGLFYNSGSGIKELERKLGRMNRDPELEDFSTEVVAVSKLYRRVEAVYSKFDTFKLYKGRLERGPDMTQGHFTGSIRKILASISVPGGKDYNLDDMFRLCEPRVNRKRIVSLLACYYDMSWRDENFMQELRELVGAFEDLVLVKGSSIYDAYIDSIKSVPGLKGLVSEISSSIHREIDWKTVAGCRARIDAYMEDAYRGKLKDLISDIEKGWEVEKDTFRPGQPTVYKTEEAFKKMSIIPFESGKAKQVHVRDSKPSFNFIIPIEGTDVVSTRKSRPVSVNKLLDKGFSQRLARKEAIIRPCMDVKIHSEVVLGNHPAEELNELIDLRKKKGSGGIVFSLNKGFGIREWDSLRSIFTDCMEGDGSDPEIEQKIESALNKKRQALEKRGKEAEGHWTDTFVDCLGVVTDGTNYLIGRHKSQVRNSPQTKGPTNPKDYLYRAGVGKKRTSKDEAIGKVDIMLQDLIENRGVRTEEQALEDAMECDIMVRDTRSELLSHNCSSCVRESELFYETLISIESMPGRFESKKFLSTAQSIVKAKSHEKSELPVLNALRRINYCKNSRLHQSSESIATIFEGLQVQSKFAKEGAVSISTGASLNTLAIRLPGRKLFEPGATIPYLFMQVHEKDTLDARTSMLLAVQHNVIEAIVDTGDRLVFISRPQRQDLNRLNTLSKAGMRNYLANNILLDTFIIKGRQELEEKRVYEAMANAFMLSQTTSLSQMSLRDPMRYMVTLAIGDASDIEGFLVEKFVYHIRSHNDLSLFIRLKKLVIELITFGPEMKKKAQEREIRVTEEGVTRGGISEFNVKSPFTGCIYRSFKQMLNEMFVNLYFVQKELHNHETNLEQLVKVPAKFQVELSEMLVMNSPKDKWTAEALLSGKTPNEIVDDTLDRFFFNEDTFTGTKPFSYDPELLILSMRQRLTEEKHKVKRLRVVVEEEEKIKEPIISIDTLTSSKSCTSVKGSNLEGKKWDHSMKGHFRTSESDRISRKCLRDRSFLLNLKLGTDRQKEARKKWRIWTGVRDLLVKKGNKDDVDLPSIDKVIDLAKSMIKKRDPYPGEKVRAEKGPILNPEGIPREDMKMDEFIEVMKTMCDDWIDSESLPVREEMFSFIKDIEQSCVRRGFDPEKVSVSEVLLIVLDHVGKFGLYDNTISCIIRMFPKGQRTFTDREIYIMGILQKIQLYYIEHTYSHVNRQNEYEVISMPGESKTYYIGRQEADFIVASMRLNLGDESLERTGVTLTNHLNADMSKWSARDVPIKFVDCHMVLIGAKPSEKLMMMMIQLRYCKKNIQIPNNIMKRKVIQKGRTVELGDCGDPISRCTKGYSRNFMVITYNWLQGNLNALSSAVHTAAMQVVKEVHEMMVKNELKRVEGAMPLRVTQFNSMVHSDDGAVSTSARVTRRVRDTLEMKWGSYARLVFYITKIILRRTAIELNLMKTFCSETVKDFVSEFLLNGEFVANAARYVVNCCGDSNFSSFKEDLSMLMASPQAMAKRGGTVESILAGIAVVNYHVYHTYSMAEGEKNDPIEAFRRAATKPEGEDVEVTNALEGVKIERLDRNEMLTCMGGYCNPPINLLAMLGSKAHDSSVFFRSFRKCMNLMYCSNLIAGKSAPREITVRLAVDEMKKNPSFQPSQEILMASVLQRKEMALVEGSYSRYDIERVNRVSILTAPPARKRGQFPVSHPSFRSFISRVNSPCGMVAPMQQLLEKPEDIVGTCKTTTQFRNKTLLSYQTGRAIDNYQTMEVNRQRLERLMNTNSRQYMPITIMQSMDKVNLGVSLGDTTELDKISSIIFIRKGMLAAREYSQRKTEPEDSDDYLSYFSLRSRQSVEECEIRRLQQIREGLRISGAKERLSEVHIAALDRISKRDQGLLEQSPEIGGSKSAKSMLQMKLTLANALEFTYSMCASSTLDEKLMSYAYCILAFVFNDKIINYFLKMNSAMSPSGAKGDPIQTIQKAVYPYQSRVLFHRASEVVKYTILPKDAADRVKNSAILEETSWRQDCAKVREIAEHSGLLNVIDQIKDSLQEKQLDGTEGIIQALSNLRRFSNLYNVLLKSISLYITKQAYFLSRGRPVNVSRQSFLNFSGNFIESEYYVDMTLNMKTLEESGMKISSPLDDSLLSINKMLDSVASFVTRLQSILGRNTDPSDVVVCLKSSYIGEYNVMEFLWSNQRRIEENLSHFKRSIPLLYHLGIVSEESIITQMETDEVLEVWIEEHSSRTPLAGRFKVQFSYMGVRLICNGAGSDILEMRWTFDKSYEENPMSMDKSRAVNKILEKLFKAIPTVGFRVKSIPEGGVYKSSNPYHIEFLLNERGNRPSAGNILLWARKEGYSREFEVVTRSIGTPVCFTSMAERNIMRLNIWNKEEFSRSGPAPSGWSLLTDRPANIQLPDHNRLVLMDKHEEPCKQSLAIKNKRARLERLGEMKLDFNISILGLSLKVLIRAVAEIEDSTLRRALFTREKVCELMTGMDEVDKAIMDAAERATPVPQERLNELILSLHNSAINQDFNPDDKGKLELVEESSGLTEILQFSTIMNGTLGDIRVTFASAFADRFINLPELLKVVIKSIIEGGDINLGPDASMLNYEELQREVMKRVVTLYQSLFHMSNLTVICKRSVLDKARGCLKASFKASVTLLYLVHFKTYRFTDIFDQFRTNLSVCLNEAAQLYMSQAPGQDSPMPSGVWNTRTDEAWEDKRSKILELFREAANDPNATREELASLPDMLAEELEAHERSRLMPVKTFTIVTADNFYYLEIGGVRYYKFLSNYLTNLRSLVGSKCQEELRVLINAFTPQIRASPIQG